MLGDEYGDDLAPVPVDADDTRYGDDGKQEKEHSLSLPPRMQRQLEQNRRDLETLQDFFDGEYHEELGEGPSYGGISEEKAQQLKDARKDAEALKRMFRDLRDPDA